MRNLSIMKISLEFVKEIVKPMNRLEGDSMPVSTFVNAGMHDGTFMHGTTAYEKRGIAVNVPEWIPENCIQCNQCAFVCPHATIRAFLLNDDEKTRHQKILNYLAAKGLKSEENLYFAIGVTPLDCTGCGNCAQVCPAPGKAL